MADHTCPTRDCPEHHRVDRRGQSKTSTTWLRTPIEQRFWLKVNRRGPDECWLWTASVARFGYGQIGRGGRFGSPMPAHRLSWEIHNGPIPPGLFVLHHCDNPPCVNPGHLFLGDQKANMQDMHAKGRGSGKVPRGSECVRAKLTPEQVRQIRTRASNGERAVDLAAEFGLAQSTTRYVISRRSYCDVA